ncbi:MAG TPA: hypothetical protein VGM44_18220 [Polyangiaceae bacterium]
MLRKLSAVALGTTLATLSAFVTASCSHPPTDRVLEPSGGGGSSPQGPGTSPSTPLDDGGTQLGPVATAQSPLNDILPPPNDYHALRSPELDQPMPTRQTVSFAAEPSAGGAGGNAGMSGSAGRGGFGPSPGGRAGMGGGIFR